MSETIRVLHVDDDGATADLTAEYLPRTRDRIEVTTATNPKNALEAIRAGEIDCIVSDYDMPEMNGLEFLAAIREDHPALPFILFTGKGSEEIASRAISADVTDYLQKGVGTEQYALLANRITNAVERFRSQKAAKRRKRRLETLTSNLPGVVYRCYNQPGWPMEWLEGECQALTGYDPERIEHGSISWGADIVHDEDTDAVDERIRSALEDGEPFELQYRIRTAENGTKWVWERGREIYDSEDELEAIEGFITELIPERRDTTTLEERERKRSDRQFEAVFDDPNVLVGLLSPAGEILDVNETAASYVDADREQLRGAPFADAPWWTEEMQPTVSGWIEAAAAGEYVEYETDHCAADGEAFTVDGSFRPVTDERGSVTSIIVSARDISERRERERELKRQSETVDTFASFVSHDLQSPITTVRGRLELALETGEMDHVRKAIDGIERVDELREDIVSVLQTGTIVSETETLEIGSVVERVWETSDPPATASVSVVDTVHLEGSETALRRLLENLVSNSVEHGGRDVQIRLGALEDGFYYEDDGPGIELSERDAVFTPGFSTKQNDEGVGMGMASVRQIVLAHEWSISIDDGNVFDGVRFEIRTRG